MSSTLIMISHIIPGGKKGGFLNYACLLFSTADFTGCAGDVRFGGRDQKVYVGLWGKKRVGGRGRQPLKGGREGLSCRLSRARGPDRWNVGCGTGLEGGSGRVQGTRRTNRKGGGDPGKTREDDRGTNMGPSPARISLLRCRCRLASRGGPGGAEGRGKTGKEEEA
nr:hypothetical protein CFP56_03105 [Quercus suber]